MPRTFFLILFICSALATASAGRNALLHANTKEGNEKPSAQASSFKDDVRPVFNAKCVSCHAGKNAKGELDLGTPASILKGGASGPIFVAGKPDESPLYEKVHKGVMPPPKKKTPLTEVEVEAIRRWIAAGAKFDVDAEGVTETTVTQNDVVPILLRRCTGCHGARRQESGLDLRTKAAMLRGGKSGPAIVLGKPEESLLIKRINLGQMPPPERLVEGSVKPVEKAEAEVLARWIAAGAPEVAVEPDVASTAPDPLVTDGDRDFWAFRPPRPVSVPTVRHTAQVRNPIDAFVLQKLEEKDLSLAPEADKVTLMRRAYFDLTGLPPEPVDVQAFVADTASDAYEKLIDRLLVSPHYGERWGRHWLDVAGYADSEGKREQDLPRPHAWRYRDYVIKAFNADKPYDRFLLEQIAGDELADYENAPKITPELYDNLVATGFLRMAPDPTWANITGYAPDRIEVITDEMDVLGSAVMGITMKCARCHNHKFDPIPQRDYYRLVAIFKGAFDEYDWLKPDIRPGIGPVSQDVVPARLLPFVTTSERQAWEAHNAKVQTEIDKARKELDRKTKDLSATYVDKRLAQLPEVLRDDVRAMLAVAPEKRDAVQKYLAEKFEKQLRIDRDTLKTLDAAFKKESEESEGRIRDLQTKILPEPRIHALWDRGEPTPTYIYRRGDPVSPGRVVGPGVPSVLTDGHTPFEVKPPWPNAKKTGRRLAFARWLTMPDQPLTARVFVNRLWKLHFGQGIVKSLDNFGKTSTPPTHPELLDWLAREFVRQKWSVKAVQRLMMTSAVYRQSSKVSPELEKLDSENTLFSRMPLVRLDAEALYDTLLHVAGRLDETPFGPADPIQARADGLVTPSGSARGWRRLVYVQQARKQLPTHLENFDYPQMNPNCVDRRDSIVAPQALELMNTRMVHELAEQFAQRVIGHAGANQTKQVESVYWIALSRPPSDEEKQVGLTGLTRLTDKWSKELAASGKPDKDSAAVKALATYCHTIMNSADFLYVD
jgi:mono/diheme cytochrome c family protein